MCDCRQLRDTLTPNYCGSAATCRSLARHWQDHLFRWSMSHQITPSCSFPFFSLFPFSASHDLRLRVIIISLSLSLPASRFFFLFGSFHFSFSLILRLETLTSNFLYPSDNHFIGEKKMMPQRLKQQAMMQQSLYHHPGLMAAPQVLSPPCFHFFWDLAKRTRVLA